MAVWFQEVRGTNRKLKATRRKQREQTGDDMFTLQAHPINMLPPAGVYHPDLSQTAPPIGSHAGDYRTSITQSITDALAGGV